MFLSFLCYRSIPAGQQWRRLLSLRRLLSVLSALSITGLSAAYCLRCVLRVTVLQRRATIATLNCFYCSGLRRFRNKLLTEQSCTIDFGVWTAGQTGREQRPSVLTAVQKKGEAHLIPQRGASSVTSSPLDCTRCSLDA